MDWVLLPPPPSKTGETNQVRANDTKPKPIGPLLDQKLP